MPGVFFCIFIFLRQLAILLKGNIKFADFWIQTSDHWCRKKPLYQLSHNHCPILQHIIIHYLSGPISSPFPSTNGWPSEFSVKCHLLLCLVYFRADSYLLSVEPATN